MAIIKLKDGRWVVYYRARDSDGRRKIKREYFGRGELARAAAQSRNEELVADRSPASRYIGPCFLEIAKTYLENKFFSENSKKLLITRLTANIIPHFGPIMAARLKDEDIDAYVRKRRGQGVKWSTVRRELVDVKAILNYAAKRRPQLIPINPVRDYRLPREDLEVIPPPTQEELKLLLEKASPHLVRAIVLASFIGCRPGGELLGITWDDVNFSAGMITVASAHKGGPSKRAVFIHPELMRDLKRWKRQDDEIPAKHVIHYRGAAVRSIKRAWWGALDRAGIRPWLKKDDLPESGNNRRRLRMYDMRHLFITIMLDRGMDPKTVSEIVGSSPSTLMRHYRHASLSQQRKAILSIEKIIQLPYRKKNRRAR